MSFSVLISYYTTSTPYSCILPQCSVCGTPSLGQHTDPRSRSLLLQYHICGMIYLSEQLRDTRYPLVEACFTGHILSFLRYSSMIRRDSSVLNSAAHRQQSTKTVQHCIASSLYYRHNALELSLTSRLE